MPRLVRAVLVAALVAALTVTAAPAADAQAGCAGSSYTFEGWASLRYGAGDPGGDGEGAALLRVSGLGLARARIASSTIVDPGTVGDPSDPAVLEQEWWVRGLRLEITEFSYQTQLSGGVVAFRSDVKIGSSGGDAIGEMRYRGVADADGALFRVADGSLCVP